jgi:hypothetical protein
MFISVLQHHAGRSLCPLWCALQLRRVLWAASRDEAMVVEHLVSIGRRSAHRRNRYQHVRMVGN